LPSQRSTPEVRDPRPGVNWSAAVAARRILNEHIRRVAAQGDGEWHLLEEWLDGLAPALRRETPPCCPPRTYERQAD
jgi:hypothetical protein